MLRRWLPLAALLAGCICTAAPAAAAASELSIKLTAADWKKSTSDGLWLVEFFSPYCGHCKHFAPTWNQLVEENGRKYKTAAGLKFAQVDCVVSGDLCAEQGIKGYPSIFWYDDGIQKDEYKGQRTIDNLLNFINQRVPQNEAEEDSDNMVVDPIVPPVVIPVEKKGPPSQEDATRENISNEKPEEGASRFKIQPRKTPNEEGTVVALDTTGLNALIDPENAAGPVFVKFYAPWCPHCKALAPTWTDLAAALKSTVNVAEVNCDDAKSKEACKKAGVEFYPTLIFFHEGEKLEYTGSRTLTHMTNFASKAKAVHAVRDVSPYELTEIAHSGDTFFLYLYPSKYSDDQAKIVSQASRAMLGAVTVYKSPSLDLFSKFGLSSAHPHLLTFKGGHTDHPHSALPLPQMTNKDQLTRFMKMHKMALLGEVTGENAKDYFENSGNPLIVFAALGPKDKATNLRAMQEAVESWHAAPLRTSGMKRDVIFAWLNAETWSHWLYNTYKVARGEELNVVIADTKNKAYYSTLADGTPIRPANILTALTDISEGKLKVKTTMNFVQRAASGLESATKAVFMMAQLHPILSIIGMLVTGGGIVLVLAKALEDSNPENLRAPKRE